VAVVEDSLISKEQDTSDRTVYGCEPCEAEQERIVARCAIKDAPVSDHSEQLNVMDSRC
jgi:hypothetical protein